MKRDQTNLQAVQQPRRAARAFSSTLSEGRLPRSLVQAPPTPRRLLPVACQEAETKPDSMGTTTALPGGWKWPSASECISHMVLTTRTHSKLLRGDVRGGREGWLSYRVMGRHRTLQVTMPICHAAWTLHPALLATCSEHLPHTASNRHPTAAMHPPDTHTHFAAWTFLDCCSGSLTTSTVSFSLPQKSFLLT